MKAVKIDPQLDAKNRARLEARSYEKAYTDIPNRALPASLKDAINVVYHGLTSNDLPDEGSTFTVRADQNGTFKRLYSPTVFSTEDKNLVIRWGTEDIPLNLAPGKVTAPTGAKGVKMSFKEEMIGKYAEPVLSVSVSSDGTIYTLPIPVRSADYENKITSDVLDMLLGENPDAIPEQVAVASDPTKRGEGGGERMQGPIVKVAHLPLGDYTVTTYRTRETDYGPDYLLQVIVDEPFTAPTRQQVEGEWTDVEVEVSDYCIVKPNSALKKVLAADPEISRDKPAILTVKEHGEYNGFPTAKVNLKCTSFVEDPDAFNIDF